MLNLPCIFELHFHTLGEGGDTSSIFIYDNSGPRAFINHGITLELQLNVSKGIEF